MASRRSTRLSALSSNVLKAQSSRNGAEMPQSLEKRGKRKQAVESTVTELANGESAMSATPKSKRTKNVEPASTPTPVPAAMMAAPATPAKADEKGSSTKRNRIADPLLTNAPLISPQTSRVITSLSIENGSPLKGISLHARTTTSDILKDACAHLIKVDPRLKPVIEKYPCPVFSPEGLSEEIDPFNSLVSGIISQQVSGAAAKSIKAKFIALFNPDGVFPAPSQVVTKDIATLRTAGLSERKAEYIRGLAEKFESGDLSTEMLFRAEYDEVLEKLIAVRGLGKWSVEMFACFSLKRMDVFSTGDLGVQRGMAALHGKDVSKLKAKGGGKWKYMSEKDMLDISARFSPYRSLYMWYLWRVEDVDISTFDN